MLPSFNKTSLILFAGIIGLVCPSFSSIFEFSGSTIVFPILSNILLFLFLVFGSFPVSRPSLLFFFLILVLWSQWLILLILGMDLVFTPLFPTIMLMYGLLSSNVFFHIINRFRLPTSSKYYKISAFARWLMFIAFLSMIYNTLSLITSSNFIDSINHTTSLFGGSSSTNYFAAALFAILVFSHPDFPFSSYLRSNLFFFCLFSFLCSITSVIFCNNTVLNSCFLLCNFSQKISFCFFVVNRRSFYSLANTFFR